MQLPPAIDGESSSFITKERDEEKVFQFLMGLNNALYGTVRWNIKQQELVPKVITIGKDV